MFIETAYFLYHIPGTVRRKAGKRQADFYDELMDDLDSRGMAAQRARLVGDVRGTVVEIGAGTGRMFPHYRDGARVVALDPDHDSLALARRVAAAADCPIQLVAGSGERLPMASGSVDAVIIAMALCSVTSVAAVLGEIERVLKPGGELRLIEHVRSDSMLSGALMHVCNPVWLWLNRQGCNMNRRVEPELRARRFEITDIQDFRIFSPGLPVFPWKQIHARYLPPLKAH